ncbi:hypothetical protein [Leucothrix arctica]|uniref:Lipoprotein n=1 Tax=Leucothrix arctica TaxID=1481894 RepID=A0A317CHT2_9GAMM|nr:hypothetical protein [Leucothrix arctica]PWQ97887.1 hypothetical protein DKT75_05325 [Leucothrix arctica]
MTRTLLQFSFVSILCVFVSACSQKETLFSEFPGFDSYLEKNKPSDALPTVSEQGLLKQYRPRVFLAEGQTRFIDFYDDYIANGALYNDDKLISKAVTPELLNQYKDSFTAEFRHTTQTTNVSPTVYGRVDYGTLEYKQQQYPLTFLSYNIPFTNSGLLKGLPTWQRALMGIAGDNADWHQLDHYVGMTVTLYENKPVAVMLQQHNYQTTWLLDNRAKTNQKSSIPLPQDSRISVDVAMQSNELYLHSTELVEHPSVSFAGKDNLAFLKTGENKPMMAGWDITHGQQEQEYTLKFLPTADAFYTFKGRLGEKRSLPGRDGPPGAQYVTLPDLMPRALRLVTSYRVGTVTEEKAKIAKMFDGEKYKVNMQGVERYKQDFMEGMLGLD